MIHFSTKIETAIKSNYGKKGYWKQSTVCKAAYEMQITMTEAWEAFNFHYEDHICCLRSKYNVRQADPKVITFAKDAQVYNRPKGTYYGD
jgi:hypothetical protein